MFLAYWIHNLSPFIIRFTETIGIRYYGLAYVLGFLAGAWLLRRYADAGRSSVPRHKVTDLIILLVFGVMLGGRLGYFLLYQTDAFLADPFALLRVWEGGMASHGGFVGVAAALWWFSRKEKVSFLHLGDLIATVTPVGLLLGRIANFINGELWGKPADVPWAVIFPASPGFLVPRHPSQLYEAALEGMVLLIYMQWRFWRSETVRTHPGRLVGEFLVAYAVLRVFCEIFREPDSGLILGLSRGTFYSIFMVATGAWLILRRPSGRGPGQSV